MFIIGRSAKGRAGLMHEVHPNPEIPAHTLCGRDMSTGSRAYLHEPILEVLCLRCMASRAKRDREGRP